MEQQHPVHLGKELTDVILLFQVILHLKVVEVEVVLLLPDALYQEDQVGLVVAGREEILQADPADQEQVGKEIQAGQAAEMESI